MRNWTTSLIATCLIATSVSAQDAEPHIKFFGSIDEARASTEEPLPLVIDFGATWCGWCNKMAVDTYGDERMQEVADRFLWVKIDIDEEKELAARYRVSGVPHTTVLNEKNRVLGGQAGYMTAEKLIAFLESSLLNPPQVDPVEDLLEQLAAAPSEEVRRTTTARVVDALASSNRGDRRRLIEALAGQGPSAWHVLLEKMADPRLAVRAAAGHTLGYVTRAPLPYHPFASAEKREHQINQWRTWTTQQNQ